MKKALSWLVLFLLVSPYVSAIAITTLYSTNYPFGLSPGSEGETFFILQNVLPEEGDITIEIELVSGSEIATLLDLKPSYFIPYGETVEVPVKIVIPPKSKIGTEYTVAVLFKPSLALDGGGNVQFSTIIEKSFPVIVVKELGQELVGESPPLEKGSFLFWIIFVILISSIIVVILLIFYFSKRGKVVQDYGLENRVGMPSNI